MFNNFKIWSALRILWNDESGSYYVICDNNIYDYFYVYVFMLRTNYPIFFLIIILKNILFPFSKLFYFRIEKSFHFSFPYWKNFHFRYGILSFIFYVCTDLSFCISTFFLYNCASAFSMILHTRFHCTAFISFYSCWKLA